MWGVRAAGSAVTGAPVQIPDETVDRLARTLAGVAMMSDVWDSLAPDVQALYWEAAAVCLGRAVPPAVAAELERLDVEVLAEVLRADTNLNWNDDVPEVIAIVQCWLRARAAELREPGAGDGS